MSKGFALIRLYSRLLAWLLHYANARPPIVGQKEFYDLKYRLLRRFAQRRGFDIQEIRKECWGSYSVACGPQCRRCGGTGIFDLFWVTLERWQWGRHVFHCPFLKTHIKPTEHASINIRGRIEHPKYGRASSESVLWLYLLCGEFRLLWQSLKNSCCCGWYIWPFLNMQRIIFHVQRFFAWWQCWCGSWFPTWGSG